jgi:DNA-binding transcriptional LysR family regulator
MTEPRATASEGPTSDAIVARLRFRHLHLLIALASGRSVRRAADRVGITQPAATKTLQEIERLFGCRLFDRSQLGLMPTPAGEILLRGARLMLADLERVSSEVDRVVRDRTLVLRLGAPPSLAVNLLPGALCLLSGESGLRLQVHEDSSNALFERLRVGELDALVARSLPGGDEGSSVDATGPELVFERLFDDEIRVAVPPNHPLASRDAVRLTDLGRERWILSSPPTPTRQAFDTLHRQLGLPPPIPFIESDSTPSTLRMVEAGAGISVQPHSGDPSGGGRWRVVWLRLEPRLSFAPVGLVYREAMTDTPWLRLLRAALLATAVERR